MGFRSVEIQCLKVILFLKLLELATTLKKLNSSNLVLLAALFSQILLPPHLIKKLTNISKIQRSHPTFFSNFFYKISNRHM